MTRSRGNYTPTSDFSQSFEKGATAPVFALAGSNVSFASCAKDVT
jgi:hypothetical protein